MIFCFRFVLTSISIQLYFLRSHSVITTDEVTNLLFNNGKTCQDQGYDIYDSTSLQCDMCTSNQTVDVESLDGRGNYMSCTCPIGYTYQYNSCSQVKHKWKLIVSFRYNEFSRTGYC
jgi:hypothetical protein